MLNSISSDELLTKAVEKHSRFNQNLVNNIPANYRLLYPDHKLVRSIPGSEIPFTLKKYKEEIDKPYSRITFFLCTFLDYCSVLLDDESSDEDLQLSTTNVSASIKISEEITGIQSIPQIIVDAAPENSQNPHSEEVPSNIFSQVGPKEGAVSTKPQQAKCPICLQEYPLAEIELHADNCAEWLLEVSEDEDGFYEEKEECSALPPAEDPKQALQSNIFQIAESDDMKRLTLRRKYLWQDFKAARQKKITPKDRVKVIFSGEPAVDDGGPRREMFSG